MREQLLALLEDGAHSAAELATWLSADKLEVIRTLKALKLEGLAWRTDRADGTVLWSLSGTSAGGFLQPTPQPAPPIKPTKHAPAVRPVVDAASWWVGLDRRDFAAAARARDEQGRQDSKWRSSAAVNNKGAFS